MEVLMIGKYENKPISKDIRCTGLDYNKDKCNRKLAEYESVEATYKRDSILILKCPRCKKINRIRIY